jgi:DNA-binding NtrC family response regulator
LIQLPDLPPELRGDGDAAESRLPTGMSLQAMEKVMIEDALRRHQGSRRAAARELGVDESTLYRKLKSLQITPPARDGRTRTPGRQP